MHNVPGFVCPNETGPTAAFYAPLFVSFCPLISRFYWCPIDKTRLGFIFFLPTLGDTQSDWPPPYLPPTYLPP
jgi:hypothetical protein